MVDQSMLFVTDRFQKFLSASQLLLLLFSCPVMSDSLWAHGLQHSSLHCPSPSPGVCSNSCSLTWWCHLTISSSIAPFSSCLQSFPASGSLMSELFASGGQSIGVSASVLWMNIHDEFPQVLTPFPQVCDLLAVQGTLKSLLLTSQFKSINSLTLSFLCGPTLTSIHDYWKNHNLDYADLGRQSKVDNCYWWHDINL